MDQLPLRSLQSPFYCTLPINVKYLYQAVSFYLVFTGCVYSLASVITQKTNYSSIALGNSYNSKYSISQREKKIYFVWIFSAISGVNICVILTHSLAVTFVYLLYIRRYWKNEWAEGKGCWNRLRIWGLELCSLQDVTPHIELCEEARHILYVSAYSMLQQKSKIYKHFWLRMQQSKGIPVTFIWSSALFPLHIKKCYILNTGCILKQIV